MTHSGAHTILIVDNDPGVVTALTARLNAGGYTCLTATCGIEAMAEFERHPVDLVISDLNMPRGDGVSLVESIRQVSRVPIVLVSGHKDEYRRRLRGVADVSFLHKPFDTNELLRIVAASIDAAAVSSMGERHALSTEGIAKPHSPSAKTI